MHDEVIIFCFLISKQKHVGEVIKTKKVLQSEIEGESAAPQKKAVLDRFKPKVKKTKSVDALLSASKP